ncbi:PHD finger protein ALFIN-LIKE 7-like [Haliotis rubra]|uniref:PHD finger protein ALFIN-LIKE 7-like n=1 Tax=Haliotis rubra TaxID=36100 RepID=UPI001EE534B5|nr:PHD finger protein ALFIN-LIKE 7-like [Haliotis rubra]
MKRDYDLRARSQKLDQGQPVYVLDLGATPGRCKKLYPVWKGPYLIEKRLSSTLFVVAGQRRTVTAHHDRMKLCRDRGVPRWMERRKKREEVPALHGEWDLITKAEDGEETGPVYCPCRQPDDGGFMIACDGCDEWFHGACVGVTETMAEAMDEYHCPTCGSGAVGPLGGAEAF